MFWRRNKVGLCRVAFVLLLVVGEAAGFFSPQFCELWPWAACFSIFISCVFIGWNFHMTKYIIALLIGFSIALHAESSRRRIEANTRHTDETGQAPEFTLKVESDPKIFKNKNDNPLRISFYSKIGDIPVKVIVRTNDDTKIPSHGEVWKCRGWLSLKKDSPHRYSRRTLWVANANSMKRVSEKPKYHVKKRYSSLAGALAEKVETGLKWCPEIAGLNKAILLGMSSEMPYRKRQIFANAGTVHVFAISGLHVMMVAALMNSLLLCFNVKAYIRCMWILPLLAAYVMLSGAKPSAIRAAIMAAFWLSSGIFGRKPDSLTAWSMAAIVIYTFSPASIFDAGCSLSFTVMLGLLLWIRWSKQFQAPITSRFTVINWILNALGISFATWIAGAPMVASLFGKISPAGIFANILVVPLAAISVVLGAAGIFSSFLSTHLCAFFNNLSALCTISMDRISYWSTLIPGGTLNTKPWGWLNCIAWYFAWFALFSLLSRHLKQRNRAILHDWQ
jgi:ComEC/Rec2-related protein